MNVIVGLHQEFKIWQSVCWWHDLAMSATVKKSGCFRKCMVLGMFIVLPAVGWVVASVVTYNQPVLYQSRAVVELLPSADTMNQSGQDAFMDTKLEAMRSSKLFYLVADKIEAETRWEMQREDAVGEIRERTSIRRLGNGRMLEIIVQHQNKEDAMIVVKSIYQQYEKREMALTREQQKHRLAVLQDEAHNLRDRQAEFRKRYMDIREKVMSGASQDYDPKVKYNAELERNQQEQDIAKEELETACTQRRMADQLVADVRFSMATPRNIIVVHTAPEIALNPASPDVRRNILKGVLAGIVLACVLAVVIYLNRLLAALSSRA